MTQPIAYAPAAPRPPLEPRAKSGSRVAGAVGFLILSLGWTLVSVPIAALTLGAVAAAFFATARSMQGYDLDTFGAFLGDFDPLVWVGPLLLVSLLGVGVMVVALFASRAILRGSGNLRAWEITFAGAGIAIVASWILSGIVSIPLQLTAGSLGPVTDPTLPVVLVVVTAVVSIVGTAVIGALSWWWMAHALRKGVA